MNMPVPKTAESDKKREVMIAAAQAYDDVQRELVSLRDQLHTAVAGLESKNSEIAELRKVMEHQRDEFARLLTEERANVEIANKARDAAYQERSDALAWLSNIELIIERAKEGGMQPARRKRNGKAEITGGVADPGGGGSASSSPGPVGIGPGGVAVPDQD